MGGKNRKVRSDRKQAWGPANGAPLPEAPFLSAALELGWEGPVFPTMLCGEASESHQEGRGGWGEAPSGHKDLSWLETQGSFPGEDRYQVIRKVILCININNPVFFLQMESSSKN